MQEASASTVLGDFSDRDVSVGKTTARFFRRDGAYWIHTRGPTGTATDYEVKYTFAVDPLQQYLIELPGGRLQAFTLAWDTRPSESGGQSWFHVTPEEADAPPGDPLHWSGLFFNWNAQCAGCHSTSVDKRFNAAKDTYDTAWAELSVGCEACHGAGADHVAWANKTPDVTASSPPNKGLTVDVARADTEIQVCSPCHARRTEIAPLVAHGSPFFDHFIPENLHEGLYYADGQILQEVYEYGSFVQSRMHARGVRCRDCHDPHSLQLRAQGDALCITCHNLGGNDRFPTLKKADYVSRDHHHHPASSAGARCVACHMPARTYMVVDERHDHGFRVPRPDLTERTGAPNTCNQCHSEQTPQWASDAVATWTKRAPAAHWSLQMAAGRRGDTNALRELVQNSQLASIVRATALDLLAQRTSVAADLVARAGADPDPIMRIAAARAMRAIGGRERLTVAAALLADPLRSVRSETAAAIADSAALLSGDVADRFARAAAEYRAAQELHADRPEGPHNLATFLARQGDIDGAIRQYHRAIERGAYFTPAYVNLADLHRLQGAETEAAATLRRALQVDANNAAVRHALGLSLVRQGKPQESLRELEQAARLAPDEPRYAFVYGVALHSTGRIDDAISVLTAASQGHPHDRDILGALLNMHRERGDAEEVRRLAKRLADLHPTTGRSNP